MAKDSAKIKRRVHFEPDNIDAIAELGENLLEAAINAGAHINASCGGNGVCGTCKVLIEKGEVETRRTDRVSNEEYAEGMRQACQSRIITDLEIRIPVESRLETTVLDREREGGTQPGETLAAGWRFNPTVNKLLVELPPPTLTDNISDLSRMSRELKYQYHFENFSVESSVIKKLANVLRAGDWKATVTTLLDEQNNRRVIDVEPGDTRRRLYALAFDIGTTGVRGQLLDLNRGRIRAQGLDYNSQVKYGADIISRIAYSQKPGGLGKLQEAVIATINGIINELLTRARSKVEHITHMVVTGNTTMIHLLLGLNPQYIRLSPYTPTISTSLLIKGKDLGIEVGEHVYLRTLPHVASYIGSDIVAGVLGTGVHQRKKLTLYIDIGTNGQIVIGNSDWMVTASCSAGPAFEGGGIKHGMIATNGAIEGFAINPTTLEPEIETIGGVKPKGICGSGLINILARLLEAGVIGQDGKFHTALATSRIREGRDGYEYVLAWAPETQIGKDIVITEVDIDNLIRAKAAMYAGCQTLVKSVGIICYNLEQVIIAGAFGSNLDIENAITIGLFPDIPRDRFTFIGNGSLLGARLAAFSTDILDEAERVARMMTNFELSENVNFMNNYIAALFLPHTEEADFPSVNQKLAKSKIKAR